MYDVYTTKVYRMQSLIFFPCGAGCQPPNLAITRGHHQKLYLSPLWRAAVHVPHTTMMNACPSPTSLVAAVARRPVPSAGLARASTQGGHHPSLVPARVLPVWLPPPPDVGMAVGRRDLVGRFSPWGLGASVIFWLLSMPSFGAGFFWEVDFACFFGGMPAWCVWGEAGRGSTTSPICG